MKIAIINGANLNLLGTREPAIYGHANFESYLETLSQLYPQVAITYFQSNVEGEIINQLHTCRQTVDAVIINPGGYTHTSIAIADAITAIGIPVLEVHISNIHARESYRHQSITGSKCVGIISGLGLYGYELGLRYFIDHSSIRG